MHEDGKRGGLYSVATEHGGGGGDDDDDEKVLTLLRCSIVYYENTCPASCCPTFWRKSICVCGNKKS
jgi:hypothetical protein